MSNINQTHCSNRWPNRIFSKEEFGEDSTEGLEVEEEDEVVNQSSVALVGYLGIIKGSALMRTVHTVHPVIIMLKTTLS